MSEPMLRAAFWVSAQIKICDLKSIPIVVVKKGDPDAGAVFLKIDRHINGVVVLSQARDGQGMRVWTQATGNEPVTSNEADAYLERQKKYDPDLWIIDIDDPNDQYQPGENVRM